MGVLTYVYALVRAAKRPRLRGTPAAMPGGQALRMLAAGDDLWLLVSAVPASAYGEAALEAGMQDLDWVGPRALAHESVVEQFLSCRAVLPMQLFTLFTSDQRALEHVLHHRAKIERILERIERHVEWGLRLTWDEQEARRKVQQRDGPDATRSGVAYLAHKKDLLDLGRNQWAAARTAADYLYQSLGREAAAACRHTRTEEAAPQSRVLLDAAFLVRSDHGNAFRTLLRRETRALGEAGVAVSLTGPWPPYNFV
jgi:hypothetical protein